MIAAIGLAVALTMTQDVWPGQPVAQSPLPPEAQVSSLPPGFTLDTPTNEGEGPWTKYQDPPLPPGLTFDPPPPPAWQTSPVAGSPEDPYAGFARAVPPAPPGFRIVSELSDAELLAATYRVPSGWEHVVPNGWLWRSYNDQTLVLTQSARQPNHIWARYELKSEQHGLRSVRVLVEVDCAGWRTVNVQSASFSRANLEGLVASSNSIRSWSAAGPDTFGEAILKAACGEQHWRNRPHVSNRGRATFCSPPVSARTGIESYLPPLTPCVGRRVWAGR